MTGHFPALIQAIQNGGVNLVVCVAKYVQRCLQYKGTSNKPTLGIRTLLQQITQEGPMIRLIDTNHLTQNVLIFFGFFLFTLNGCRNIVPPTLHMQK